MLRIQLVIEDYGELIGLQTTLKKVGFDVDATQSTVGLGDQLVSFNPDLVIMTGFGRKVNGFEFAKQLRRTRGLPHVILLHDASQVPENDPGVEAWHAMPDDGLRLLGLIAVLARLNENVLREKFLRAHDGSVPSPSVGSNPSAGRLSASSLAEDERRARYKEFLATKDVSPTAHGFTQKQVREQVKALRLAESGESNADLEKERRDFVAQLFKRGT